MDEFRYNYIKFKYPVDPSNLLFADTGSLTNFIQIRNLYEDMCQDKHLFDFSGYDKASQYFNEENKKVLGKVKDEMNGVGLRANMYSVLKAETRKAKKN